MKRQARRSVDFLLISLVILLASPVFATRASAANSDFIGTWTNSDPSSRSIDSVLVSMDSAGSLTMQVFGRCHPTACDWGTVSAHVYAARVDQSADTQGVRITGSYDQGFSHTEIVLEVASDSSLRFETFTHFTDNSGRSDYSAGGMLTRVHNSSSASAPQQAAATDSDSERVQNAETPFDAFYEICYRTEANFERVLRIADDLKWSDGRSANDANTRSWNLTINGFQVSVSAHHGNWNGRSLANCALFYRGSNEPDFSRHLLQRLALKNVDPSRWIFPAWRDGVVVSGSGIDDGSLTVQIGSYMQTGSAAMARTFR